MMYCEQCNWDFTPSRRPFDYGKVYCPRCGGVDVSERHAKTVPMRVRVEDTPPKNIQSVPLQIRGDMQSYIIFRIQGTRSRNAVTDEREVQYTPTIVGFKQADSAESACVGFARDTQQLGDYVAVEVTPVAIQFGAAPSPLLHAGDAETVEP